MIATIKKTYIDVCFECPSCESIHWLEYKYVKRGYEIECYCGEVLEVKPTTIDTVFSETIINKPVDSSFSHKAKVRKVLLAQGFNKESINVVVSKLHDGNVEDLVKEAISLL